MKNKYFILAITVFASILGFYYFKQKNNLPAYGYGFKNSISQAQGEIGNFALLDHRGEFHELYRNQNAKAVVFISQTNDCPINQKFSSTLNDIRKKYLEQGIIFFMINPSLQDTRQKIIDEAKNYNFDYPILLDPSQVVSTSLGITRSAEAVVIDPNGWKIVYRGAISDRLDYGADKQTARNNYLEDVLTQMMKGEKVNVQAKPAKGCLITFADDKEKLSYEKNIAPIIKSKCLTCHADNGNFPPKLTSYDKIKSWMAMSKETIMTERMPPFSADKLYGEYSNDISLTAEEKRLLIKWFNLNAPKDGSSDPLLNYKFETKPVQMFGKLVYSAEMPLEHPIPPGGEIEYKYFQLGGEVPYEFWSKGYWTKSTNPRQLHHESLFVVSKPLSFYEELAKTKFNINEEERKKNTDGDIFLYTLSAMEKYEQKYNSENYTKFQVWGAGRSQPFYHAKHVGVHVPKGAYLILETHYMGTGRDEKEKTKVEFYGFRKKPKHMSEMFNITLSNLDFKIPPNNPHFEVQSREWIAKNNILIRSFLGHLHMRGKSIKVIVKEPSDKEFRVLVSIPNYNYGWQTGAALAPIEPIKIKAGSILKGICVYDNSSNNPYNPDPTKTVHFGQRVDRTEMCKFNMGYTIDKGADGEY